MSRATYTQYRNSVKDKQITAQYKPNNSFETVLINVYIRLFRRNIYTFFIEAAAKSVA